jgi:hypothetical protein
MSYMKHYREWLKEKGLLNHPKPMSFVDEYHRQNPQMIPKPIVKEVLED